MFTFGRVLTAKLLTLVLLASAFGVAFADSGSSGSGSSGSDNSGSGHSGSGNSGSGNSGSGNSGSGNSGQDAPSTPQDQGRDDNSGSGNSGDQNAPVAGERMSAKGDGKVMVRLPNGKLVAVDEHASIPIGSVVDTRHGSVKLNAAGGQWAVFTGAVFQLRQASEGKRPVTELVLQGGDFSSCGPAGSAAFAAKRGSGRKAVRGLWGSGKGNFRTRGRHGAATVRGTKWYTADTCDGTLVKVKRGKVAVRDFARKRTVLVRRGGRYLARPAPKPARRSTSS